MVLERTLDSSQPTEVSAKHELVFRHGAVVERVLLDTGTRGVPTNATVNDLLDVSFEPGTFFSFIPYPAPGDRTYDGVPVPGWYCLAVEVMTEREHPWVKYAGKLYEILTPPPCLVVRKDFLDTLAKQTHKLPGVDAPARPPEPATRP